MKLSLLVAALVLSLSSIASAKGQKKPTICTAFTEQTMVIEGVSEKVAVCTDRAKPIILLDYTVVSIKEDDGVFAKMVVGWR